LGKSVESVKNDNLNIWSSSKMPIRQFKVIDVEAGTYEKSKRHIEELEVLRVVKKYCEETLDDKEVDRTPEWLIKLVRFLIFQHFPVMYS